MRIPRNILQKIIPLQNLSVKHPINIVVGLFEEYSKKSIPSISCFRHHNPLISTRRNFDELLINPDHPSRSESDTYYFDDNYLLRTHLTPNELEFLELGLNSFIVSGPAFRRDEIDSTHYPIFHQVEGVHLVESDQSVQCGVGHLKGFLEGALRYILGENTCFRWNPDSFPFTSPSFELEAHFDGKWIEVAGCGILKKEITGRFREGTYWAFGAGVERLAMLLFGIPDIRLLWSQDERFLEQFENYKRGMPLKYQPISQQPSSHRDISFWIEENFADNFFFEAVRNSDNGIVESVKLLDSYKDPKSGRQSKTFRIVFRSHLRPLCKTEVDEVFERVRNSCGSAFKAQLR